MLSVIIPSYNEEQMIEKTSKVISELLENENIDYELLFVNDGSSDNSWNVISEVAKTNKKVKGVNFSRNFGKESAIFAGLNECSGECAVVIDCDLQHPPEKIIEMYRLWEDGYEIVEGVKVSRGKESIFHSMAAKAFYAAISDASGIDMAHASDYKLIDRKAINVLINMPEKNAFFRALSSWVGFKSTQIEYDVREREVGETKWSTKALVKYAITNVTSFTSAPMQVVTALGVIMFVSSIALTAVALYQKLTGTASVGFTTVIILQCFIGSVIMISLGILGYYISKIYEEIKGRPRFIISERTKVEHHEED